VEEYHGETFDAIWLDDECDVGHKDFKKLSEEVKVFVQRAISDGGKVRREDEWRREDE